MANERTPTSQRDPPGLATRRIAVDILDGVLRRHRPLDEQLDDRAAHPDFAALAHRDRALVRALVTVVLRRLGTLRHLLGQWLKLPADEQHGFDPRRVAREGAQFLAAVDTIALDTPEWLMARWVKTFGAETARAIAVANGQEPALDLTVKDDPEHWARTLGGRVLPTGSVRAIAHGTISQLPGYAEGAWWVQDAAAALPAKLFGDVRGRSVADLCAAPGGKTAQLAAAGGRVIAVDRAPGRLERLRENLARLHLTAETAAVDVMQWRAGPFDAVLLDAPCSSTGTIRRHPDIPWLKRAADIAALATLQRRLVAQAGELTKPGGILIYCTCSLEPEEGVDVIRDLLDHNPSLRRQPISAAEVHGRSEWLTADGDLRTLPCHLPDPDSRLGGLDGFYAARLQRI